MSKKHSKMPILIGTAALLSYRLYKGEGVFGRIRFPGQNNAADDYIAAHYPGARHTSLVRVKDGWSCCISYQNQEIVLYMAKAPDNTYIFWEKEI